MCIRDRFYGVVQSSSRTLVETNSAEVRAVPSALTVPLVERGEMDWTLSPSPSTLISTSLPARCV